MKTSNVSYTKSICVDFDGTIASFTKDLDSLGEPIPGAIENLKKIHDLGYKIIIHTARPDNPAYLDKIGAWLASHGIPCDGINLNPATDWESRKPLAEFYLDDRALPFGGDWDDIWWQVWSADSGRTAKEEYDMLLSLVRVRAEAVRALDRFLASETNWFASPASSKNSFHLCEEGGLLRHCVNVAKTLLRLRRSLAPELPIESCVIVALFHDLGKVGWPGVPYYLPNPDTWQVKNRGVRYVINPACVHMDIASRSLALLIRHIELSPEEAQAIRFHDGQYIEENKSVAHRETPLALLLQYADNWSGEVLEKARADS